MTTEQRFWKKVKKTKSCWLWSAAKSNNGYGKFSIRRSVWDTAHRISWAIHFGPVPGEMWVLHTCDVRHCVNPSHLFLGDRKANMDDMFAKQRHTHGERHWNSKLTNKSVREIRKRHGAGEEGLAISRDFGVSDSLIGFIVRRKIWKHI